MFVNLVGPGLIPIQTPRLQPQASLHNDDKGRERKVSDYTLFLWEDFVLKRMSGEQTQNTRLSPNPRNSPQTLKTTPILAVTTN